jgi:type II secretory pathway predicted ATPase ExeA
MYETFYGLSGKPFSLLPDPAFLYPGRRHRKAINLLDYSLTTGTGFMVITGEVGAGKTTVVRHYLKSLGPDVTVGLITNSSKSLGRLLGWVNAAYDLATAGMDDGQLYNDFVTFLVRQYAIGKRTVLIIDEAQNLTVDMLEDLRMLSNVNNERDQLLQIILVGQPELLAVLNRPDLRQLVQRIGIHCHLTALDAFETAAYIRHRLGVVDGDPALFDDAACAAVHYFTAGVPRLINLLCDQALMYAFAEDQATVGWQTVAEVAAERNSSHLSAFRALPEGELWPALQPLLADIEAAAPRESAA